MSTHLNLTVDKKLDFRSQIRCIGRRQVGTVDIKNNKMDVAVRFFVFPSLVTIVL
jgi:hypothetical protein